MKPINPTRAGLVLALLAAVSSILAAPDLKAADLKAADLRAVEILAKADAIRNPQMSFVVDVALTAYENSQQTDSTLVTTHSRKETETGQFLSLVHINQPVRDDGKLLLRNGNILWFYDPASKASVRLSPRQRLVGNASNGDVVTANFALDYAVELAGEEEVTDGDRKSRPAYRLNLVSQSDITPYHAITLWVDRTNHRPLKGQFFAQSGRLLKVAWYRGWEPVLGETRPTEVIIADGFDPKKVTVMKMSNYRPQDLPPSWFSNSWLPHFRKQ
ncbi:outer membrane lipoprotein-sorting protein [Roseomonas genomospecies 6]|uniref:Outer membrane lipoprotein-sorting protein n=1 Tax=Roseomonas genomospecies 6 TaxID=214106 RepID=A0A9W7TYY3_9PROT|nr:outer membrane lipoprotein-sorting protein [Roseomonas genomospecies 6]KAA0680602.1 outer membrane lipoprotein-sorting protein [Roseomonas genomospecies 6]